MSEQTVTLSLTPRDGLFVKDARGWHAVGRAHSHPWPPPQTLLGALRAGYGRQVEAAEGRRLGADWVSETAGVRLDGTLAVRCPAGAQPTSADRMWPVPADALALRDQPTIHRLEPVPLPSDVKTLGLDDDAAREALWWPRVDDQSKPAKLPKWWTDAQFTAWLTGRDVPKEEPEAFLDPPTRLDVHVGIDRSTFAAEDGRLFAHEVVETLVSDAERRSFEWRIACRVTLPRPVALDQALLTLGGKQRLAACEPLSDELFDPPAGLLETLAEPAALRLVVVSPTLFGGGWLPDGLAAVDGHYRGHLGFAGWPEVRLRAAFVPRPVHVSGWDIRANGRGQPKPTLRLVPPGAVYFVEPVEGRFTAAQVQAAWLAAWGDRTEQGYGRVVPGIWTPRSSS